MNNQPKETQMSPVLTAALTVVVMVGLYLFYMMLWQATSPVNPPVNEIDLAVKTPAYREDWFIRRETGLNPQRLINSE